MEALNVRLLTAAQVAPGGNEAVASEVPPAAPIEQSLLTQPRALYVRLPNGSMARVFDLTNVPFMVSQHAEYRYTERRLGGVDTVALEVIEFNLRTRTPRVVLRRDQGSFNGYRFRTLAAAVQIVSDDAVPLAAVLSTFENPRNQFFDRRPWVYVMCTRPGSITPVVDQILLGGASDSLALGGSMTFTNDGSLAVSFHTTNSARTLLYRAPFRAGQFVNVLNVPVPRGPWHAFAGAVLVTGLTRSPTFQPVMCPILQGGVVIAPVPPRYYLSASGCATGISGRDALCLNFVDDGGFLAAELVPADRDVPVLLMGVSMLAIDVTGSNLLWRDATSNVVTSTANLLLPMDEQRALARKETGWYERPSQAFFRFAVPRPDVCLALNPHSRVAKHIRVTTAVNFRNI
jgi:hypothetical protein